MHAKRICIVGIVLARIVSTALDETNAVSFAWNLRRICVHLEQTISGICMVEYV